MIGSLLLTAALSAAPAPMMGDCKVSAQWGTELPEIPMDQQRHVIHVQGKQMYWNGYPVTVERAVRDVGGAMADGIDMLVIDASSAKCGTVTELAAALEGPAACTPQRCFVSSKAVPARKKPE